MRQSYCIKQECLRKAQGAFLLAHKLGLLETPSMEGFEARRQAHNRMLKKLEQDEWTRLKVDCVQPSEAVRKTGLCPEFTEAEKRAFYEQNMDLFGRYDGDFFTYEEVAQIIEKRLREDAYDKLIENVLREFEEGE